MYSVPVDRVMVHLSPGFPLRLHSSCSNCIIIYFTVVFFCIRASRQIQNVHVTFEGFLLLFCFSVVCCCCCCYFLSFYCLIFVVGEGGVALFCLFACLLACLLACLCVRACVRMCLCESLCVCVCLCLCLCLSVSVSVCLSVSVSVCVCVCLSVSVSVCVCGHVCNKIPRQGGHCIIRGKKTILPCACNAIQAAFLRRFEPQAVQWLC